MVLNIYREKGINSYFTEDVSYSPVLPVRAPVGVSGSKKSAERTKQECLDENAAFMFLVSLRWWTKLTVSMNYRRYRVVCLHMGLSLFFMYIFFM